MWWWTRRVLRSGSPQDRKKALQRLGNSSDRRAVDLLIRGTCDNDLSVAATAFVALKKLPPKTEEIAFNQLRNQPDPRTFDSAVRCTCYEDAPVVYAAFYALWVLGVEKQKTAIETLSRSSDPRASKALARLTDPLSPWRFWGVGEEKVGIAAVEALAKRGGAEVVQVLLKDHGHLRVDKACAEGLAKICATDPEPLLAALPREKASMALEMMGSGALEPLNKALPNRPDPWVRRSVAQILGKIGDKGAIGPLLDALRDTSGLVRRAVAAALRSLGWQPADDAQRTLCALANHSTEWRALEEIGIAAVEPLLDLLKIKDFDAELLVAIRLAELGDVRAVEPLLRMLTNGFKMPYNPNTFSDRPDAPGIASERHREHDEWKVIMNIIGTLGQIGDARAVDPLTAALKVEDWAVRNEAAKALGKIGGARAVKELVAALKDEQVSLREAAASALGQIGDARAVDPLTAALKDEYSDVREAAAEALKKMGAQ